MSQPIPRAVSGFYPQPVPVSLSDQAAVFPCGEALYRVDSRFRAAAVPVSGQITQTSQWEDRVFALQWTDWGEAAVLEFDQGLRLLNRRFLFRGGKARSRELIDPYDLADWRNQTAFCLLDGNQAVRLTFRPDEENPDLTAALLLNRIPLEGGPAVRQVIGGAEIEAALGGNTRFSYFDIHADHTRLRVHRGRAFIEVKMCDLNGPYPRHLLLQVNEDGVIVPLWDSHDCLDGWPCFFDFDRDIMWTIPFPGEPGTPERNLHSAWQPLVARRMALNAPVLPEFPAWKKAWYDLDYFDGEHCFFCCEEDGLQALGPDSTLSASWSTPDNWFVWPIVLWQDKLLLDLDGSGRPMAYPIQFDPPAAGEALSIAWEEDPR